MTTHAPARAFHLEGNFRPVTDEVTAVDLPVTGHIPDSLDGTFVRNGPNPIDGSSPHWFLGNGMVHGVRLVDGRACWYRNRYVRTNRFHDGAPSIGADGTRDLTAGVANTNVIQHAGRVFAIDEASFPWELTSELDTVGCFDFEARLRGPMTAHPKTCPHTGELHFFGYDFAAPYLTYHVADGMGRLVTSRVIDVPGATMMHDFSLTERFVVFMDLPAVFNLDLALAGTMPYRFDPSYGARLGVVRRDDPHGAVRWFDVEPCYVFHQMNAHDDHGRITIDVIRHADLWFEGEATPGRLWRWTIDLTSGSTTEQQLDDLPCEFPRIDDRLVSQRAVCGWVTSTPRHHPDGVGAITAYNLETATNEAHRFEGERVPAEAVFAPANTAGDQGWLLTYVYDPHSDRSDLVILDIDDLSGAPVAVVHLPARVPFGFHGSWLPAERHRMLPV